MLSLPEQARMSLVLERSRLVLRIWCINARVLAIAGLVGNYSVMYLDRGSYTTRAGNDSMTADTQSLEIAPRDLPRVLRQ